MKTYWVFLALVGIFAFVILFLADRERKAGLERFNTVPHAALEDHPGLRRQTERGPYSRNERH